MATLKRTNSNIHIIVRLQPSKDKPWYFHNSSIELTVAEGRYIDPVSGLTLESAIKSKLNEIELSSPDSSPKDVESQITRIIERARENAIELSFNASSSTVGKFDPKVGKVTGVEAPGKFPSSMSTESDSAYNIGDKNVEDVTEGLGAFWKAQREGGKNVNGFQETVGGADMAVFFLAEVPIIDDLVKGIAKEEARKELIVLEMDNVLSLQYSILREVYPVRQLGNANPVDFTRGPRTIAGHIAFAIFSEDILGRLRSRVLKEFEGLFKNIKNNQESLMKTVASTQAKMDNLLINEDLSVDQGVMDNKTALDEANAAAAKMYQYYDAALHFDAVELLDSLPPFHLLVMGINENGVLSKFLVKNIQIIDENQLQGTRQPNIMNKASFVARDIVPMSAAGLDKTVTSSMNDWAPGSGNNSVTKKFSASQALSQSIRSDLEI